MCTLCIGSFHQALAEAYGDRPSQYAFEHAWRSARANPRLARIIHRNISSPHARGLGAWAGHDHLNHLRARGFTLRGASITVYEKDRTRQQSLEADSSRDRLRGPERAVSPVPSFGIMDPNESTDPHTDITDSSLRHMHKGRQWFNQSLTRTRLSNSTRAAATTVHDGHLT